MHYMSKYSKSFRDTILYVLFVVFIIGGVSINWVAFQNRARRISGFIRYEARERGSDLGESVVERAPENPDYPVYEAENKILLAKAAKQFAQTYAPVRILRNKSLKISNKEKMLKTNRIVDDHVTSRGKMLNKNTTMKAVTVTITESPNSTTTNPDYSVYEAENKMLIAKAAEQFSETYPPSKNEIPKFSNKKKMLKTNRIVIP